MGGLTWRGMLQKKIISPPPGQDYATDSGELNAILGARVSAAFPGLFVGSSESTGVTVSFQYQRYVTMYDGLKALLKSVGYKMQIEYDQARIIDRTGINHLVCLGSGELRNRIVVHLYVDGNGVISQTQTFFNENEIAEVYDYAGASRDDLIQSGVDQLKGELNLNEFAIELESEREVQIGDIVGSRDYITGYTVTAPITTKIVKFEDGFVNIEYKLSSDVEIEQIPVTMALTSEVNE